MTEEDPFRCRVCGSSTASLIFDNLPDRLQRMPGRFAYVRCTTCDLVQLEKTPADLGRYYKGYGRHQPESLPYAVFRRLITGTYYVMPRASGSSRRLLDYGCGNGWYVKAMKQRGWDVFGYEFDAKFARALSARVGVPVVSNLSELDSMAGSFDLITMNFVFEHLDQPVEAMASVLRLLRPGGEAVLAVPNLDGREAKVFGRRWFHLDPPRHIVHFNKKQLCQFLTDHGFSNPQVRDLPMATGFAGSLSYVVFGHLHPALWYPGILPGLFWALFVRDGLFRVTASKPASPS